MIVDLAVSKALDGYSNDDCIQIIFDDLVQQVKTNDSDYLTKQLSLLIGVFALRMYPIRHIDSRESDRLLLKFSQTSAALRLIRHEKKQAEEFGAALDAMGIPRDKAYMVLADCKHVLEDGISG
jgi:hypothetical protein